MNTPWNRTYFEKDKRMRGRQGKPKCQRTRRRTKKNECMHDKNYQIACDLCVHECDSKIMMYNFNIRRNSAQHEKKRKRQNEYRMCKRKEKQTTKTDREKKIFFFSL